MGKAQVIEKKKQQEHTEVRGLVCLGATLLLSLSLLSFRLEAPQENILGLLGWGLGWGLSYAFGLCSYLVVCFLGWLGWQWLLNRSIDALPMKITYTLLFIFSCSLLLNVSAESHSFLNAIFKERIYTESFFFNLPYPHVSTRHNLGGVPSYYLYKDLPTFSLQRILSDVGIGITFSMTALVCFLQLTQLRLYPLLMTVKKGILACKTYLASRRASPPLPNTPCALKLEETLIPTPKTVVLPPLHKSGEVKIRTMHDALEVEKKTGGAPQPSVIQKRQTAIKAQEVVNGDFTHYQLPPPSLLHSPKKVDHPLLKKELKRQAEILEETLLSFGIEAKVGEINCGPTIASFEVHPAVGVKVQKIKTLENDIALNLEAKSIRIIAPIPGKAAVGVEIPALHPQEVSFKELLVHYQHSNRKMLVPLLLGKTVSGDNVISDLSKMPHCLIAGATGSGKSVCINTIIMSILMNARPDEIKLIMIDPKKVELTPYARLPHMIAPVITEAHGAYAALSWLVKEMQTRYDILKQLGVRNISAFNHRQINPEFEASLSTPIPAKMHMIVAIIDEFADLMMASSSDLETPIARIAQMARAVGIHLILATQRPSREVITGLIKANFPTRLAFKVSSRINSQIILDDVGAENLLGNGDMLFLPPGTSALIRSQGAFISDEEIQRVVHYICDQAPPRYLIDSFDKMRFEGNSTLDDDGVSPKDSLYEQALQTVVEMRTASTTFLQRKLKIGYARAASLMDELEAKGVISPQEGAKPRRILIDAPHAATLGDSCDEKQELLD